MHNPSRLVLIQDISNFSEMLARYSVPVMIKTWTLDPAEHFDDYLEWVIGHFLTSFFQVGVHGHYRKEQIYLSILEECGRSLELLDQFKASIDPADLNRIRGMSAKLLINGCDLFIMKRQHALYQSYL